MNDSENTFSFACAIGDLKTIREFENPDLYSGLEKACANKQFAVIKYLLEQGADPIFALEKTSLYNDLDTLKYLNEIGVDIHTKDEKILRIACMFDQIEIVKFLVEHGANFHIYDEAPLRLAVIASNFELVKYFVKLGADVNALDYSMLQSVKCPKIREYLLENGAIEPSKTI